MPAVRVYVVVPLLLVTVSVAGAVSAIPVPLNAAAGYRYATILVSAKMLPPLIGARAGSLEALSLIGGEWVIGEIYVVPEYKEAYNPLSRSVVRMPLLANDTITDKTLLVIRVPLLRSGYTADWDVGMALHRLHERIYVEAVLRGPDGGAAGDIAFYIYFDHRNTHRTPIPIASTYFNASRLIGNATAHNGYYYVEAVKDIRYEKHSSFILSYDLSRIIAYDVSYKEFVSGIVSNAPEPPWYLDGGGVGDYVAPGLDYYYFIPLAEAYGPSTMTVSGPVEKTIYIGYGVSYLELNLEAVSHTPGYTTLYVGVEVARIDTGETVGVYTYVVPAPYLEPVVFRKRIPVPYNDGYYNVTIIFNHPYASVKAYLFLAKDFDGGGASMPTNEIKYYSFGYSAEQETVSAWSKPMSAYLPTGRALLLTTPVPQGFYGGGAGGLDDESYLSIKIQYDRASMQPCNRHVSIYLNGRWLRTVTLNYQGEPVEEDVVIPYTEIRDIVAEAVASGTGLAIAMETDAVSQNEYLAFPEIQLRLPFHPEVWRPRSMSFAVSMPHILGAAGHPVFNNYNIWGWHTLVLSGHEYSRFTVTGVTLPVDHVFIAEEIASGMAGSADNPETYVMDVYVEIILDKRDFSSPYSSPGYSVLLDRQVNGELDEYTNVIKYGHMALGASAAIYDLFHSLTGASTHRHPRLGARGAVSALLFVLGIGTEILLTSMASVEAGWRPAGDGEHVVLYAHWSGGIQPAKYVRLRITATPNTLLADDAAVIQARSRVIIQGSTGTGYIEAEIPGGTAYRHAEPFVVTGRPMTRQ